MQQFDWANRLDILTSAVAYVERSHWPKLGLAITRRVLRQLCTVFNDQKVKCLCCFSCGQLRTTFKGLEHVGINSTMPQSELNSIHTIDYVGMHYFLNAERRCPGTLLNNFEKLPGPRSVRERVLDLLSHGHLVPLPVTDHFAEVAEMNVAKFVVPARPKTET